MTLLPDGLLAALSSNKVYLWNLYNGTLFGFIDFDPYRPSLSVLPNGHLALANNDQVNIYNPKSKSLVKIISDIQNDTSLSVSGITAITTLRNGNLVTSNGNSPNITVKIWNTANAC